MRTIKQSDEQAIVGLEQVYGEPHVDLSQVPTRALTLEVMRRGHTNTCILDVPEVYKLTVLMEDDSVRQINGSGPVMIMEIMD
jgi:hypothetical protein